MLKKWVFLLNTKMLFSQVFNIETWWYQRRHRRWLLWPFSLFFQAISYLRRQFLLLFQYSFPVPVIVVGNLSVGGVGKTPLVIALALACQEKGIRVGIVSRGYGASLSRFPHSVALSDTAANVGDEPLLIAQKTGCPVVISPNRVDAVRYLLDHYQSELILSDDGLQHYAMGRALEIAVIDGLRGLGNGMCIPAGPLREPRSRLHSVDFIVVNDGEWPGAYPMVLDVEPFRCVLHHKIVTQLPQPLAAVAAIGNPARFFQTLARQGLSFHPYAFPDHHVFTHTELVFPEKNVVMTEKDAVKCQAFAEKNWYFLPVSAKLSDSFWQAFWSHEQLKGLLR